MRNYVVVINKQYVILTEAQYERYLIFGWLK
jgi:hypothetical protein